MKPNFISTTDHNFIKEWAEKRSGHPQVIDHEESWGDKLGIRIDFPVGIDEAYSVANQAKDTTWDEFFRIFEQEELAFLYDENESSKNPSDLYRFKKR